MWRTHSNQNLHTSLFVLVLFTVFVSTTKADIRQVLRFFQTPVSASDWAPSSSVPSEQKFQKRVQLEPQLTDDNQNAYTDSVKRVDKVPDITYLTLANDPTKKFARIRIKTIAPIHDNSIDSNQLDDNDLKPSVEPPPWLNFEYLPFSDDSYSSSQQSPMRRRMSIYNTKPLNHQYPPVTRNFFDSFLNEFFLDSQHNHKHYRQFSVNFLEPEPFRFPYSEMFTNPKPSSVPPNNLYHQQEEPMSHNRLHFSDADNHYLQYPLESKMQALSGPTHPTNDIYEKKRKDFSEGNHPVMVKNELLGKENAFGKPWGKKVTYSFEDPHRRKHYMRVSEVKLSLHKRNPIISTKPHHDKQFEIQSRPMAVHNNYEPTNINLIENGDDLLNKADNLD